MDKYDSMSDGELRELMARRLGYVCEGAADDAHYNMARIYDPDGNLLIASRDYNEKPIEALIAECWEYAVENIFPNLPQNAADALALLQQTGYMLWWNGGEWEVQDILNGKRGEPGSHGFSIPIITSHQNPARAITIAFLRWQDAQET